MYPLRVFVLTCNKYQWAVWPFSYLFNMFWSSLQPVVVGGFSLPNRRLPSNFTYYQIDKVDYPPEQWSNGLIKLLESQPDEYLVLLLEDYWLCRGVDHAGILTLLDYMKGHPDVVRFDLTADRLYGRNARDVEFYGHYDIIECSEDAPYQMSLQAAIWKKDLLLKLLVPNRSAWETELYANMIGTGMRVLGTRQYPVRYANGIYQGKVDQRQIAMIPEPHRTQVLQFLPKELENRTKYD